MIKNFLLADDDPDDSDLFNEALKGIDSSIEFNYASNGKELIEKLQLDSLSPQVIFLDINMPEMNGWECLESLKKEEQLKDIPVIMYSTSSSDIYVKRAIKSGALAFYEKPPNFLQLQDFLKSIAGSSTTYLKKTLKELQLSKNHSVYTD
jgi:CheY-like chemotaxis protein